MQGILSIQSHVVYGHAGNSSAVFPMQRMGFEVWPIHTVQYSSHIKYKNWTGRAFAASDITQLVDGIDNIDQLKNCAAVVSGYVGSKEQCSVLATSVARVKHANPNAIYVCDPVMGGSKNGFTICDEICTAIASELMPIADIIVPNEFELARYVDMTFTDLDSIIKGCRKALEMGPKMVLVKHLHTLSKEMFSMMLVTPSACYLAQRPFLPFAANRQPVGAGDLITALFTSAILQGKTAKEAFALCSNGCYAVLKETYKQGEWELQTIAAQNEMVNPSECFPIIEL